MAGYNPYGGGGYGAPPPGYGAPYGGAPAYGYSAPPAFPVSYGAVTNPRAAQLFMAVDTDRSGSVTAKELQVALSSGGYVFNSRAVKKMIAIFDVDSSGTLSYAEFEKLLETLQQWTTLFNSADRDRSGKLSNSEVKNCLRGLGFNLPEVTLDKMMSSVDDDASGYLGFDEFVLLLCIASSLTSRFRSFDGRNMGYATLDYASFMGVVFSSL